MKNLNIFYPSSTLYPNESGGVSLSQYWLLRGLYATKKINLTTLTTTFGIPQGKIKEDIWLNTDYGKVMYLKVTDQKKITFLYAIKVIIKSIPGIKENDIIHIASIFDTISIYCFIIASFYKKKVVWSTRGSVDDVEFKKKGFLKKAVLFLIRPFIKNVVFHTTSNDETHFAYKYLGKEIKLIQITNYIVLPKKLDLPKENYFLFIGRFHYKKGIDNLLKALKLSRLFISSEYVLKIVGDFENEYGYYILSLHQQLELGEKVVFLGHKGGEEKQEMLAKAYWSFMPSYSENFGIVATEALAQGTPVVASIYTPWESLEKHQAGFWIDNTVEVLSEIIDKIILMPSNEYEQYSKNAIDFVKNEFDVFRNSKQWIKAYENC